jgi:hypothetical protein
VVSRAHDIWDSGRFVKMLGSMPIIYWRRS